MIYREYVESFWSRVDDAGDCWDWQGYRTPAGYGLFWNRPAHRIAWMLSRSEPIEGRDLHHRCGNRACCRPSHLEPLLPADHRAAHPKRRWQKRGRKGTMSEVRPNVWRLRVYLGRSPTGSPIQASRTVRGTREDAQAELARMP